MCLHFCSADRGMCWKIWTFLPQKGSLQPWRDDWGYGSDSTESAWQCRKRALDPWVRKIPWRREWLSTPVFLPRELHGQRSLVGYSPWGCKESDMTDQPTLWLFTHIKGISSVQSLSHVRLFVTPWTAARQASLSITNSQSSLRLTSIESVMPSSHLILCHPLLLLPPVPPSIRVFSNESILCMRWPKYCSFNFSIIPSKETPGLISFRMDWLDLLAVQGTLKSLLQHHSSKASILQCSAFFTVQLSHPHMTTGKTIALTRRTFVGKVMSLLLNMLSRLVITFLPRSKCLLISWLQSSSAVILEAPKITDSVSTVSPSVSHEVMGPDAMIFVFWMLSLSIHTGKTIALTRRTFFGKVMSLLFTVLSRLVIAFLPRSKCLNFTAAVTICSDFGALKSKVCHCFHCFSIYLLWSDETGCHDLSFLNVEF